MNLAIAFSVICCAIAAAVGLMLLVRRWSPPGAAFTDSDRAAGVFGVVGTGFAVLLAFVIFLAFESYDRAREQASREALATSQLYHTAKLFSPAERRKLQGELICYARAVVHDEWRTMRDGQESALVDGWLARIEQTIAILPIDGERERIAYGYWFDQSGECREARRGRLAEAAPFVPPLVWLALLLGGSLIIAYMCFYADRLERKISQAMMMAAVTAMVASGLLVVRFLDNPYENASGSIKPIAMTTTLEHIKADLGTPDGDAAIACDEHGFPGETEKSLALAQGMRP
jgi:multisubunit Na+/H+ antiporter MnhB subunit